MAKIKTLNTMPDLSSLVQFHLGHVTYQVLKLIMLFRHRKEVIYFDIVRIGLSINKLNALICFSPIFKNPFPWFD